MRNGTLGHTFYDELDWQALLTVIDPRLLRTFCHWTTYEICGTCISHPAATSQANS